MHFFSLLSFYLVIQQGRYTTILLGHQDIRTHDFEIKKQLLLFILLDWGDIFGLLLLAL